MELTKVHFQAVSILSASSPNIYLNDIKKGLGHWPSFIVWSIIIFQSIYIKYIHRIQKDEAREPMEASKAYEKDHL